MCLCATHATRYAINTTGLILLTSYGHPLPIELNDKITDFCQVYNVRFPYRDAHTNLPIWHNIKSYATNLTCAIAVFFTDTIYLCSWLLGMRYFSHQSNILYLVSNKITVINQQSWLWIYIVRGRQLMMIQNSITYIDIEIQITIPLAQMYWDR